MSRAPHDVLFLCTGNSARSILAEALLARIGQDRFRPHSAGSHPRGEVHPMALELLRRRGHDVSTLRSKHWDEFAGSGAPQLDLIFTVCDDAAGETCPLWPGQPVSAHWGIPDPAAATGSEALQRAAFERAYAQLERRIGALARLSPEELASPRLASRLEEIARRAEPVSNEASWR